MFFYLFCGCAFGLFLGIVSTFILRAMFARHGCLTGIAGGLLTLFFMVQSTLVAGALYLQTLLTDVQSYIVKKLAELQQDSPTYDSLASVEIPTEYMEPVVSGLRTTFPLFDYVPLDGLTQPGSTLAEMPKLAVGEVVGNINGLLNGFIMDRGISTLTIFVIAIGILWLLKVIMGWSSRKYEQAKDYGARGMASARNLISPTDNADTPEQQP